MKCTVIFKRNSEGEIELYRQVERSIAQEGATWDESMKEFGNRLIKTLNQLSVNQRLVMKCELIGNPTRQEDDSKKGS